MRQTKGGKRFFMFRRIFFLIMIGLAFARPAICKVADYERYFKVDMKAPLPSPEEMLEKYLNPKDLYDKGYESRYKMGNRFKSEFSKVIKFYGLSEKRLKNSYEDELLEALSWLPKDMYQYVGPMLHEVPGMSEKILNLPGIKETKNKFPERVAQKAQKIENIEFLSPALYILLMPELWGEEKPENLDKPEEVPVKKPRPIKDIPNFLRAKIGQEQEAPKPEKSSVRKKTSMASKFRSVNPTLTSPLTTKDAEAFVSTLDEIVSFGEKDGYRVYGNIITGEYLLDMWEQENKMALPQNELKDAVNPCQRLILKMRFGGVYNEFKALLAKYAFTPEEWAYVGDKTIRAFRVASATSEMAHAVSYHKKGYYDYYIEHLPEKWKKEMYANEAAIIKMYSVFREDVEAVLPLKEKIDDKFIKIQGVLLTAPIIY